jgi:hypothetical protein
MYFLHFFVRPRVAGSVAVSGDLSGDGGVVPPPLTLTTIAEGEEETLNEATLPGTSTTMETPIKATIIVASLVDSSVEDMPVGVALPGTSSTRETANEASVMVPSVVDSSVEDMPLGVALPGTSSTRESAIKATMPCAVNITAFSNCYHVLYLEATNTCNYDLKKSVLG